MKSIRRWFAAVMVVLAVLVLAGPAVAAPAWGPSTAFAEQPPPAQDEFIPMDQIPPEDQLPSAPLLITAYAFVWLAVFGYLWSIWRRLSAVERELGELSRRLEQ